MLREILVNRARHPTLRRAASWAFHVPMIGGGFRKVVEAILPSRERVWTQIPSGVASGLWLKVLAQWEPGYLSGCAEEGMNEAVSRHLKPGDCFYDVGAHVGYYSLIAARIVGEGGNVMSFEPDPENAQTIRENVAKNGFNSVKVVCAAMSDHDGIVRFRRSPQNDASRMSGMLIGESHSAISESEIVNCQAITLDAFCRSHPLPDLIKIDVEGAELQVLAGTRDVLARKKPVLIIEVHDMNDLPAIRSFLSGFGYTLEPVAAQAGVKQNFVASVSPARGIPPRVDQSTIRGNVQGKS